MATTPQQIQYMLEHPHQSLHPSIIASTVTGLALAYIAVALRFLARYKSKMGFASDDWLIVAAALCFTPYTICAIYGDHGKHIIYVRSPRVFVETFVAAIVAYSVATFLTKISILAFYCRIFPSRGLRRLAVGLGIFIAIYNIALILTTSLMCIPLSSLWTQRPGKCIATLPPFLTLGIVNVLTDVVILAIPVRFVVRLQMSNLQKVQVCGIFLTGALVCVFGITRTVALGKAAPGDPSYNQAWSGIWSACEGSIGIVAACLPTMGFFFVKAKTLSISTPLRKWSRLLASRFSRSRSSAAANGGKASDDGFSSSSSSRGPSERKTSSPARSGLSSTETPPPVVMTTTEPKPHSAWRLREVFVPSHRLRNESVPTENVTLSAVRDHPV